MSAPAISALPELVVTRWVDTFNSRDLGGMLACLDSEVEFHPLRLGGLDRKYVGHIGVERWFAQITELGYDYRMVLSNVRGAGEGEVLAVGVLSLAATSNIAPFCARNRVVSGTIRAAHQYFSDPDTLERLGLIA